jgi:hypothetical protein
LRRFSSNESSGSADTAAAKKLLGWMKAGNPKMFVSRCVEAVSEADRFLYALAAYGLGIYSVHVMTKFWRHRTLITTTTTTMPFRLKKISTR